MATNREVQEPRVSDEHARLFHYTTESGLYGILKSQVLWATEFSYLNDRTEYHAARPILTEAMCDSVSSVLKPLVEKKLARTPADLTYEDTCRREAEQLIDICYETSSDLGVPFITSFCAHSEKEDSHQHGLLSQWRGYGHDGGFALVFDTATLEKLMEVEAKHHTVHHFAFTNVVYGSQSTDFHLIDADAQIVATIAERIIPYTLGLVREPPMFSDTYLPFMRCASRYKHAGFKEENEVRMVYVRPTKAVVSADGPSQIPISIRPQSGSAVPYLKLFGPPNEPLPIKRIIVGPHPQAEHRRRTLELFLEQENITAEVHLSDIPYLPR